MATLLHQLIRCIPDLKPFINAKIIDDPLIFTKSLDTQFTYLIFDALRELTHESINTSTILFLFDGVDECVDKNEQAILIKILSRFIETRQFSLIVFFGSRAESQISMTFNDRRFRNSLLHLKLDKNYDADEDIRTFLDDSFLKIIKIHPRANGLSVDWPPPD